MNMIDPSNFKFMLITTPGNWDVSKHYNNSNPTYHNAINDICMLTGTVTITYKILILTML